MQSTVSLRQFTMTIGIMNGKNHQLLADSDANVLKLKAEKIFARNFQIINLLQ